MFRFKIGPVRYGIVIEHARKRRRPQHRTDVMLHLAPVASVDVGRQNHQPGTARILRCPGLLHRIMRGECRNSRDHRHTALHRRHHVLQDARLLFRAERCSFPKRAQHDERHAAIVDHPGCMPRHELRIHSILRVKSCRHCRHYAIPIHAHLLNPFLIRHWSTRRWSHACAASFVMREGRYGSRAMGDFRCRIISVISRAVAIDAVIPSPSCPVARSTFEFSGDGPIRGSLSGVAARKPVQIRSVESVATSGIYSQARSMILRTMPWWTAASSSSYCRDEPISICPVARGCRLNATESPDTEWAVFKYPNSTTWCRRNPGYRSVIIRCPLRLRITIPGVSSGAAHPAAFTICPAETLVRSPNKTVLPSIETTLQSVNNAPRSATPRRRNCAAGGG